MASRASTSRSSAGRRSSSRSCSSSSPCRRHGPSSLEAVPTADRGPLASTTGPYMTECLPIGDRGGSRHGPDRGGGRKSARHHDLAHQPFPSDHRRPQAVSAIVTPRRGQRTSWCDDQGLGGWAFRLVGRPGRSCGGRRTARTDRASSRCRPCSSRRIIYWVMTIPVLAVPGPTRAAGWPTGAISRPRADDHDAGERAAPRASSTSIDPAETPGARTSSSVAEPVVQGPQRDREELRRQPRAARVCSMDGVIRGETVTNPRAGFGRGSGKSTFPAVA